MIDWGWLLVAALVGYVAGGYTVIKGIELAARHGTLPKALRGED